MKNINLRVLNQDGESGIEQEYQQELEMLERNEFEYDEEFLTFSGRASLIDADCMVNLLKELTRKEKIYLPASVYLIIYSLHKISFDKKSGYFSTTFEEIESHCGYLDNNTISKSLNILKKYNLICYFSGKGQRKSFIALRNIYNSPEGRGYKEKIKIKDVLRINGNRIEFLDSGSSQKSKELETETFNVRGKSKTERFSVKECPHIYIHETSNIMKEKENLIKEKDKEEGKAINCNQSLNEITINTNIKETEARIKNNLRALKSALEHKVKRREDGVWYEIPYDEEQKCRIKELVRFIQEGLSYINEQRKLQNKPVIEKKYTAEQIIWYARQDETKQELLFK